MEQEAAVAEAAPADATQGTFPHATVLTVFHLVYDLLNNLPRLAEVLDNVSDDEELLVIEHKKPKKACIKRKLNESAATLSSVPHGTVGECTKSMSKSLTVIIRVLGRQGILACLGQEGHDSFSCSVCCLTVLPSLLHRERKFAAQRRGNILCPVDTFPPLPPVQDREHFFLRRSQWQGKSNPSLSLVVPRAPSLVIAVQLSILTPF